jgi:hypothetical protein
MAKVREKQLRDALVDVDYPVGKQALLEHARRNGADGDVLAVLRALPPVEYGNFAEVLRSVDTEEATGQSAARRRPGHASTTSPLPSTSEPPATPDEVVSGRHRRRAGAGRARRGR